MYYCLFRPLVVTMIGFASIPICSSYLYPSSSSCRSSRSSSSCLSSSRSSINSINSSRSSSRTQPSEDIESEFSRWFSDFPKSTRDPYIYHSLFGTLRGMEWNGNMADVPSKRRVIANVPRQMVLQSDNFRDDWDVQLTKSLWQEFLLKEKSDIYGYCQLLLNTNNNNNNTNKNTKDDDDYQATTTMNSQNSVSPNAIRHWDDDSKSLLSETMAGKKLVYFEQTQMNSWKKKYDDYLISTRSTPTQATTTKTNEIMTWDQFLWIMEVVHSRAFSGDFGTTTNSATKKNESPLNEVAKNALFPLVAAVGGIIASQQQLSSEPPLPVLLGLGAIAVLPLLLQLTKDTSVEGKSAVLLPLIDSANHMEEADSSIQYDPISNAFQLSVGPNCLVPDTNNDNDNDNNNDNNSATNNKRTQLFISYGKKKDSELLLNYGFLANVPCSDGNDEQSRKYQRIRLAEEYIKRNR